MFVARIAVPQSKAPAASARIPSRAPETSSLEGRGQRKGGTAPTDLSAVPPFTIQRTFAGDQGCSATNGPLEPEIAARINGARGAGRALAPATRSQMERFFGDDFSGVRLHDDARSHRLNQSLSARAFTLGRDIFLGANASAGDGKLMTHELTHVVQQRGARSGAALTVGAPDTAHEREADANAALSASAVPRKSAAHSAGDGTTVQRFLQGEEGHGGIEARGLKEAGFAGDMTSGDIGAIYFGNWLRDWSQVSPGSMSPMANALVFKLLNILSWGEFNRPLDPAQLGGYLPSEHMDNPLGGPTVETAGGAHAGHGLTQKQYDASLGTLSPSQSADFLTNEIQPQAQSAVAAASKASGLPDYIERSKAHIRAKLQQAIGQGRTPDGMLSFGDALHGIEDYYAHSNFTEVALAQLAGDKNAAAGDVLAAAKRQGFDATSAAVVGNDPLKRGAAIVTGTVGDESHNANQRVSLIETLRSEILTGSLRGAFVLGVARTGGTGLLGAAGKLLGGLVGGIVGGIGGFFQDVGAGIGRLFGRHDDKGFGSRTKSGAASGMRVGAKVGGRVGDAIGGVAAGIVVEAIVLALVNPILLILSQTYADPSGIPKFTKASAVGAPGGKPTHSQISKDSPDHPVHAAAAALAEHADAVFGKAMISAWSNPDKSAAAASVLPLVDRFIAYPGSANRDVWQHALETAVADGGKHKDKPK